MFGKIDLIQSAIILTGFFAIFTDIRSGRIYNGLTVPVALSGFIYNSIILGLNGSGRSIAGFLLGLVLYGWMFALRVLGGGDVKLLMALGAWGGPAYVTEVSILGILLGGAYSLGILVATGRIISFSRRMYFFFLTFFIKEFSFELPKIDKNLKMPFGIPISIAAVWVIFTHPLNGWLSELWH